MMYYMTLTRSDGSLPEMVWFKAMTLYPTDEHQHMTGSLSKVE